MGSSPFNISFVKLSIKNHHLHLFPSSLIAINAIEKSGNLTFGLKNTNMNKRDMDKREIIVSKIILIEL